MSGPKYLDALASERAHNGALRKHIVLVAAVGAIGIFFAWRQPKDIEVHLAPDLKAGDTVHVSAGQSPVPPQNAYGFAYYIWQQVNRWQADGSKDYGQQIYNMQSFLTPRCQAQLTGDMDARAKSGELRMRTRQISEIPGFSYNERRVIPEGTSAWTVLLDMQVMETYRGEPVKDVFIRYPLRVVRYDVDRERNPWQLALDCYGSQTPARLNKADLQREGSKNKTLNAPELPTSIAPASLPNAIPADGQSD